ncbi:pyridoxal phosphate-dependent decarboxylase family protein [Shimazuella alba]|uniref:Aspartate aminotransferase family protein n=1 Tax=Shimazuella alba TaxID=2690964 RepID=A0A6I4VUC7_9BACL|nr:aspartate aminotransferase family protein [Shimazuella alba]MXQ55177.1 aspartate aminotransferase family protein [Shimazuella alba]
MFPSKEKTEKSAEHLFLNNSQKSWLAYQHGMTQTHQTIYEQFANLSLPYSGISIHDLKEQLDLFSICPEEGRDLSQIIISVGETILKNSIAVHHPNCCAHLHCPPLIPALAAEAMISASNQSMDSWDQSSAATLMEEKLISWLCHLFGYQDDADGVFTSGGTQSNFMGLLLARDQYIKEHFNWNVKKQGLPSNFHQLRILCSTSAHFTVKQSAALLGLGENAVVTIETDEQMRMCLDDLDKKLDILYSQGLAPFALVATAGSTDFGAIDPILACSKRAKHYRMWLHVDAAYGGALLLSDQYKHLLTNIELADSITVDFHKLFYQPISCGAFLLKRAKYFNLMKSNADYLNPEEHEHQGIPDLVAKSIQTTRRFDALKLWISLQAIGRKKFAELLDYTIELAKNTSKLILHDPSLELLNKNPTLNAIVFRYTGKSMVNQLETLNRLNIKIRQNLVNSGKVILAQTKCNGIAYLKLTMLNPLMTIGDVTFILNEVKQIGELLQSRKREDDKNV